MPSHLPPMRLTGGRILREGRIEVGCIALAEGRLREDVLPAVDVSGYLVLPGIIDLHGDGFERHMAPRPNATFPFATGFASYDREAAGAGVTTAYLAQGWSWEGGHRGPDHAERLMAALQDFAPHAMTDLRIQLRAETHLISEADRLLAAVQRFGVGYVVFNDHLEEGFKLHRLQPVRFANWAGQLGLSAQDLLARLEGARGLARQVPRTLCRLAQGFDGLAVTYGSHDDPDAETRQFYAMIGAQVAEFPTTRKAAAAACSMDNPVLLGAPNVVRGGSQSGNVAAAALIADGLCHALLSDYHLPTLALSAWALVDQGISDFATGWGMISTRAAEVVGLNDRGRIAAGLRADLVILDPESRRIEATISGGRLSYLSGGLGARFLGLTPALRMAAE
jgi:alpha-D-ribose 1-methylphosphonate 5-triphosphate diphosphatase